MRAVRKSMSFDRERPMKVKDKVCVVTGAAGGIGEAVARRYAKEGAKGVVVADRDADRLRVVADDIRGLAVACDVAREADIQQVAEAERRFGPVDVFFSNAGIGRGGHEDATDKDWADSWAIHVMSHVYAARALVPGMLARKSGYLLNTASAAGLLASMGSAPVDGVLHTDAVAQTVIEAMDEERFLILTHPEVKEYMARKLDRDRWLRGMRRLRDKT